MKNHVGYLVVQVCTTLHLRKRKKHFFRRGCKSKNGLQKSCKNFDIRRIYVVYTSYVRRIYDVYTSYIRRIYVVYMDVQFDVQLDSWD